MEKFGSEIAITGKRPEWLADDVRCKLRWNDGVETESDSDCVHGWERSIKAIRLPIDHWAYTAIDQGFTPWAGGDEAPGDWDGGVCLMRFDSTLNCSFEDQPRWTHEGGVSDIIGYRPRAEADAAPTFKTGDYVVHVRLDNGVYQIQSDATYFAAEDYRPATPAEIAQYLAEHALEAQYKGEPLPMVAATVAPATVTLPVMTEEEAEALVEVVLDDKSLSRYPSVSTMILAHLGLVAGRPTDIEAFEDFHGGLDNNQRDIAEMAIKWAR